MTDEEKSGIAPNFLTVLDNFKIDLQKYLANDESTSSSEINENQKLKKSRKKPRVVQNTSNINLENLSISDLAQQCEEFNAFYAQIKAIEERTKAIEAEEANERANIAQLKEKVNELEAETKKLNAKMENAE